MKKTALSLCLMAAISACSPNKTADDYILAAKNLTSKSDLSAAVIELKNAIAADPKHAQARFLLGKTYLNLGEGESAVKEFEKAINLNFNTNDIIPLLTRAYVLTEQYEDIISLDSAAASLSDELYNQYLAYKTLSLIRLNKSEESAEALKAAEQISKTSNASLLASAYYDFYHGKIARAKTSLEHVLSTDGQNVDAVLLMAQVASVNKEHKKSADYFKQYYQLQPQQYKTQLFIADELLKANELEEAEKIADGILKDIPSQPFANYLKATARFYDADYQAASNYSKLAFSAGFNLINLKLVAGVSEFYLQNYEQSHDHLSGVAEYLGPEHPARRMLAISQLKLGYIDDIGETLKGYKSENENDAKFLTSLSYELLGIGAIDEAKELVNRAGNENEIDANKNAREGVLRLMMNDAAGIEQLTKAVELNPELIEAELALAFAFINNGDLKKADKIAEKWLKQYPEKSGGYNLKSAVELANKNWQSGKKLLLTSLEVEPNNVYALTKLVKLAYFEKNIDEAKALSAKALAEHPNNIEVLKQFFELNLNSQGLSKIKAAYDANSNNIDYSILYSQALVQLEMFTEAKSILDDVKPTVRTPKRYWRLLLMINAEQKGGADVREILDLWRKTNPYHLDPALFLADYWLKKKDVDQALLVLNNVSPQHQENEQVLLGKMRLLLVAKRLVAAKKQFEQVRKLAINEDFKAGIEGEIYLLDNKFAQAIPKLKKLYKFQGNARHVLLLAAAYKYNNQPNEAITLLQNFLAKSPEQLQVRTVLANYYIASKPELAIEQYEFVVKQQPNNVVILNNLAWLTMQKGQTGKALSFAEQAYSLAPKNADVMDTYSQTLLQNGDNREALKISKQAYEVAKPEQIEIALNYAEALIANQRKNEASKILAQIQPQTPTQIKKLNVLKKVL